MVDSNKKKGVDPEERIPTVTDLGVVRKQRETGKAEEIRAGFQEMAQDVCDVADERQKKINSMVNFVLQGRLDDDPKSPSRNIMPAHPLNYALMNKLGNNAIELTNEEVEMINIKKQGAIPVGYPDITFLKTPDGTLITMYIRRDENKRITAYQALTT